MGCCDAWEPLVLFFQSLLLESVFLFHFGNQILRLNVHSFCHSFRFAQGTNKL